MIFTNIVMSYKISYMIYMWFSVHLSCMHFPSDAGIAARVEEPIESSARDSEEE
jgi:hypothetical protein